MIKHSPSAAASRDDSARMSHVFFLLMLGEVGQVAALGAMLLLLAGLRKGAGWVKFSKFANVMLVCGGAFLFIMQCHGYWHETMELEVNKDVHKHLHEDMESEELEDFN